MPVTTATTNEEARSLLKAAPSPVVVIAVYNSYEDVVRCLEAVTAHTAPDIALLVIDDGGPDRRFADVLQATAPDQRHSIVVLRHAQNLGFVRSCNHAFAATPGRDVVLLNSDVVVGAEWLERLTATALSSDTIATATSLTNHGTILSVPHRNEPTRQLPDGMTAHEAAQRVAAGSLQLRPSIPTAIGHCFYIRRSVLDLLGGFDECFDSGYGEEVDFCQRALAHGFRHVCADDVFTYHRGGGSFGSTPELEARKLAHEAIVRQRYPWYWPNVQRAQTDPDSTLADALGAARRSLLGLTIGVDALCLGPDQMGTQQIVVETIRALARRKEIKRLVAFVPLQQLPQYVVDLRTELPGVEFIGVNPVLGAPERVVDLIYRPYQVSQLAELDFLHRVGDRFVVNQLDTIAFGNPAYFGSDAQWLVYRDLTRLTLQLAHGIAFLSDHGRSAAAAEGLVDDRTPSAVVSCGIAPDPDDVEQRPMLLDSGSTGYVLCVGASYLHKGRRFALEVWAELRRRGWTGRLVLAGPTPPHGNSLAREAEFLLGHPDLRPDVITLGSITEAEKRWLYRHAALVLYPSVIEGFGIVPFEAASFGVPTLASGRGSMQETLRPDITVLESFEVPRAADQAWRLLHDPAVASALADALHAQGRSYEWERTAERLVDLFGEAFRQPRGRILVLEGEGEHPVGLASRAQRAHPATAAFTLERLVKAVVSRPALKSGLSPDGSRRQRMARNVISHARRRIG